VRIDAALADEFEPGQAIEQGGLNCRAFANEHQAFGIFQARRDCFHCLFRQRNYPTRSLRAYGPAMALLLIGAARQAYELVTRNSHFGEIKPLSY
jgi:hypothetical protein